MSVCSKRIAVHVLCVAGVAAWVGHGFNSSSTTVAMAVGAPANYDLELISVSFAPPAGTCTGAPCPRVEPGGSTVVTVLAKNTGNASWLPGEVSMPLKNVDTNDPGWTDTPLSLLAATGRAKVGTFRGTLGAPGQIGLHSLTWRATSSAAGDFGPGIVGTIEVTCSNGDYCDGDERLVMGECRPGTSPCDDGTPCTTDDCTEDQGGLCAHALQAGCEACFAKNCNPNCMGKACGDDGCGGGCPPGCAAGLSCVDGTCQQLSAPGTCANPLPILQPGESLLGLHTLSGDTTDGFNEVIPTCQPTSAAREKIYTFTIPSTLGNVGIDARSSGYDTVLHLRKDDCLSAAATVLCTDDSSPPGNFGSRIGGLLSPGTYSLIVDGFDGTQFGPYSLTANFVAGCAPACDGKFCGDDGCGGSCGTCGPGQVCSTTFRCVDDPCTPACGGRQCGFDGCSLDPAACGSCPKGKSCEPSTGTCHATSDCDHERPVCKTACSSQQYCGSDCECHDHRKPQADLTVNRPRLENEMFIDEQTFSNSSCAVAEGCAVPGTRRLLHFSVQADNQGNATLTVPPPDRRPDLFEFSPCHGHYHFKGFAEYALLDLAGNVKLTGRKLAFCMEDTVRIFDSPEVACDKLYDCTNQGIQTGWADIYGNTLDCQWLDITDLAPGDYLLQVTLNPSRLLDERSFANNSLAVPVTIPRK
jgi:hypothetical protein